MKDDFEIIDLDNTTNLSLTQVNLEVEELEKELKRLQESEKAPSDVPKKVSNGEAKRNTSTSKPVSGAKKPVKKVDGKPVKKAVTSADKKSTGTAKKAAPAAKPAPKKKQPLVSSKTLSIDESWDDLHDISAKEAKKASDSMKSGNSVYKTNTEAYAKSDSNVADMLAEYDEISNSDKPKRLKKRPEAGKRPEAEKKPVKATKKPQPKAEPKPRREEQSVREEHHQPKPISKPVKKEPEIQITPVATTGVRLGNKSGTSIGSVGGSYGLNQVGGTPRKSRYQMELERASREAQLVYESNRSANRSAAATINAKKEAEAAISYIDEELGVASHNSKTIDVNAKHAATAKGAPIMGGPRTAAATGKASGTSVTSESGRKTGSGSGNKPKNNSRYTRDFDYEEPKENKLVAWLKDLTAMDYIIGLTALFIVVAGIVVFNIFATSRNMKNQIASFAEMGSNLSNVGIAGESTLLAMADNRQFPEEEEFEYEEEEYEVTEYEENEDEDADSVTVTLSMQSVVKDLKIKFVNKKTEKLIAGVPFEVEVTDANGKTISKSDEDKDGIIYINPMAPGDTTVKLVALSGYDKYKLPTEGQKVTVKESPDYKKIDVANEVKSEKQVNAAVEDTAQQAQVESVLTDTVEWVESTKTATGSDTRYTAVSASDIAVPTVSSKVGWINKLFYKFKEFTDNSFIEVVRAACDHNNWDSGEVTTEATCSSEGVKTYHCQEEGCSETKTETIGKADHSWDGGEVTTEATCASDGVKTFKCSNCGEAKTETVSKTDHTYSEGKCTACGAADPNYTAPVTPTPTTPGKCTEHAWRDDTEVPADCTHDGYKTYICAKCKETKKDILKAKGHSYKNGVCTVCRSKENTVTPTPKVNNSAKLLTKNGEQLYIKSGDSYKVATAGNYFDNPDQTFYKQSSEATGYRYTGWQELDGNTYFFDKDGNKVTGEQVIQGARYNFGSDGALQKGSGNLGIDVSKWNGSIDWNKVKSSGVSYVIIRCGYRGSTTGALIEDPKFKSNISGATKAGLKVGIYFFSQATNEVEAIEEASMTLSLIGGSKISYPIFLDVEPSGGRGDRIDSGTRTQVINAYCNTIRNSGYTPGVYANKSWLETKFSPGSINGKIWLAQYAANPTYGGGYQMWQYSKSGKVSGISGNVDMNLSYLGY